MKVITQRDLIKGVADRWYEQYGKSLAYRMDDNKKRIYRKLYDLNKHTATADDVNAIIGNNSWTHNHCSECKQDVANVIEIGGGEYTTLICFSCFDKAKDMVSKAILMDKGDY